MPFKNTDRLKIGLEEKMWLQLTTPAGKLVDDPIYIRINENDLLRDWGWLLVDGFSGSVVAKEMEDFRFCKTSEFEIILLAAYEYAKRSLRRGLKIMERLEILFEAYDIFRGQEDIWVASRRNYIIEIEKVLALAKKHPQLIFNIL